MEIKSAYNPNHLCTWVKISYEGDPLNQVVYVSSEDTPTEFYRADNDPDSLENFVDGLKEPIVKETANGIIYKAPKELYFQSHLSKYWGAGDVATILLPTIVRLLMNYLVTEPGKEPFMTSWFDSENHFVEGMIVYYLPKEKYTTDGINWNNIKLDSL